MSGEAPLRVTFLVLNLRMGGQVSNLASLAPQLKARGLDVRFALPPGVPGPDKEALDLFSRKALPSRLLGLWRMVRSLPREEPGVVHVVLPSPAFCFLLILLRTPRDRILVQPEGFPTAFDAAHRKDLRDDPGFVLPRLILNNRRLAALARRFRVAHLVTTEAYAAWLRNRRFEDVTCVPNLADSGGDGASPSGLVPALPPEPGACRVAYVGHAHPVKGVDDLIEAFALAQPRRPGLALTLALSSDGDRSRILRRIRTLPSEIQSRIQVAGLVCVPRLLAEVDALVLPYRSLLSTTLYPSLLLEAEAAGCPLLLSEVPELASVTRTGGPGLHRFPPRDAGALASALERLPRREEGGDWKLDLPPMPDRVEALVHTYRRLCRPASPSPAPGA